MRLKNYCKELIKRLINILQILLFLFSILKIRKKTKVLVLDIDNTLADTWPYFSSSNSSSYYRDLPLLNGTKSFIDDNYNDYVRIFLSHRPITKFHQTKTWLKEKGLYTKGTILILTRKPDDKIIYLKRLNPRKKKVVYIDDLSYNHENGDVKFYFSILLKLEKLNITYYGYEFIQKINFANQSQE